jgi:hypothetical protein
LGQGLGGLTGSGSTGDMGSIYINIVFTGWIGGLITMGVFGATAIVLTAVPVAKATDRRLITNNKIDFIIRLLNNLMMRIKRVYMIHINK